MKESRKKLREKEMEAIKEQTTVSEEIEIMKDSPKKGFRQCLSSSLESVETAELVESTESAEPVKPVQVETAEPANQVESAEQMEIVVQVESVEPSWSAEEIKEEQVESVDPMEITEPATQAKPVKPTKPATSATQAKPTTPATPAIKREQEFDFCISMKTEDIHGNQGNQINPESHPRKRSKVTTRRKRFPINVPKLHEDSPLSREIQKFLEMHYCNEMSKSKNELHFRRIAYRIIYGTSENLEMPETATETPATTSESPGDFVEKFLDFDLAQFLEELKNDRWGQSSLKAQIATALLNMFVLVEKFILQDHDVKRELKEDMKDRLRMMQIMFEKRKKKFIQEIKQQEEDTLSKDPNYGVEIDSVISYEEQLKVVQEAFRRFNELVDLARIRLLKSHEYAEAIYAIVIQMFFRPSTAGRPMFVRYCRLEELKNFLDQYETCDGKNVFVTNKFKTRRKYGEMGIVIHEHLAHVLSNYIKYIRVQRRGQNDELDKLAFLNSAGNLIDSSDINNYLTNGTERFGGLDLVNKRAVSTTALRSLHETTASKVLKDPATLETWRRSDTHSRYVLDSISNKVEHSLRNKVEHSLGDK
tara:strand:+ start:4483 stop:6255 length:1773 start_codon:yes stop_codon:yes gene_type:complete